MFSPVNLTCTLTFFLNNYKHYNYVLLNDFFIIKA